MAEGKQMADFDPFANQGGPAAWDPEHHDDSEKLTEEFLKKLRQADNEPGSGPSSYSDTGSPDAGSPDADYSEEDTPDPEVDDEADDDADPDSDIEDSD